MADEAERPGESHDRDEEDRRGDEGDASIGSRRVMSASPLIWILLAAALGWAIWATVTRNGNSSSKTGSRAVVVSTRGADRMVVALPCSVSSASSSGASKRPPAGDSVVLPRDSGDRVVLIPGCSGGTGGAGAGGAGGGGGGSSKGGTLQVLDPSIPVPKPGSKTQGPAGSAGKVRNVFAVPASNAARLIVVPPCSGSRGGSSSGQRLRMPPPAGHAVLVAPPCQG